MKSSHRRSLAAASATVALFLGCGSRGHHGAPGGALTQASTSAAPRTAPRPSFTQTGPLLEPRVHHTATLLASGLVLVTGGQSGPSSVSATTELYDPATGRTTQGPPLGVPRMHHAALVLPSGAVLVAGGQSDVAGHQALDSTEVYDPATGAWTPGPRLSVARSAPAIAAFRDRGGSTSVLVAGGAAELSGVFTSLDSADIYLPATNTTTPAPFAMIEDRFGARAVTGRGGEVLIVGGYSSLGSLSGLRAASSEVFEPATARFVPVAMNAPRAECALVDAGEALALGGTDGSSLLAATERFANLAWTTAPALAVARRAAAAVALLASGSRPARVLAIGGLDASGPLASCEVVGAPLATAPVLAVPRAYATATLLADGSVLVTGGLGANRAIVSSIEVFSPRGGNAPGALAPSVAANAPTATGGVELLPAAPPATGVTVTALVPAVGVAGSTVTIAGTGFDPNGALDQVTFNGAPAAVVAVSVSNPAAETLTVVVPANATSGPVSVTVGGHTSPQAPTFTVAGSAARPPVILAVAPAVGPVFMPVSISGQDFGPQPLVTFNGVPTASILGASTQTLPLVGQLATLVVLVPPGATSGPLVVRNGALASAGVPFTVR